MNKRVLWFSRHRMTDDQLSALEAKLGPVNLDMVNGNMPNVHVPFEASVNGKDRETVAPFKELVQDYDVIAIVAPINLQQQILGVAGERPVILADNKRVLIPQEDGTEDKVEFVFGGWKQLKKIDIVLEPFV